MVLVVVNILVTFIKWIIIIRIFEYLTLFNIKYSNVISINRVS